MSDAPKKHYITLEELLEDPEKLKRFTEEGEKRDKRTRRRSWRQKHHWKRYSSGNKPYPSNLVEDGDTSWDGGWDD